MRYQQGGHSMHKDLQDCRRRGMELAREKDRWLGIAQLFYAANHEQNSDMMAVAVEAYDAERGDF